MFLQLNLKILFQARTKLFLLKKKLVNKVVTCKLKLIVLKSYDLK